MPTEYGLWQTVYKRHNRWSTDGTWSAIVDHLRAGCDEAEGTDWTVGADSSVVRAHQHAAGARRQPPADGTADVVAEVVAPLGGDTGGGVE